MEEADLTLIRVEPEVYELKRYEVFHADKALGWVIQFMSQLDLSPQTSRIRRDGKRRPFWTYVEPSGKTHFRVKLETRKDALRWLTR